MTLGEKLEELGYKCNNPYLKYYKYHYDINIYVLIELSREASDIYDYGIAQDYDMLKIVKQEEIDNLQIAFNRLKKDIKEIEKWQKQIAKYSK